MATVTTRLVAFVHFPQMLDVAKRAASDAALRSADSRAMVGNLPLISVVFATIACETCINEMGLAARLLSTSENAIQFSKLMTELEDNRANVRAKFLHAKRMLTGREYDKGRTPYQNFDLLEQIRNQIVHGKASSVHIEVDANGEAVEHPSPLIKKLRSLNILATPVMVRGDIAQLSTPAVAAWACQTADEIIDDILGSAPFEWAALLVVAHRPNITQTHDAGEI